MSRRMSTTRRKFVVRYIDGAGEHRDMTVLASSREDASAYVYDMGAVDVVKVETKSETRSGAASSRSKPKRAGAKKRTVARLRRAGGGVRRGYGVFKHGAAPRTYEKGGNEKFTAFAFGHRGNSLGKWTASSIIGAMTQANASAPVGVGVTIRGEFTSDGSHHGLGKGRVVMVRENGRWIWM